jgi:hypothetical protein
MLTAAGVIVLPLTLRSCLALAAAAILLTVVALCWVLSDASRSERLIGMITASRGGRASTAARPTETQAPRRSVGHGASGPPGLALDASEEKQCPSPHSARQTARKAATCPGLLRDDQNDGPNGTDETRSLRAGLLIIAHQVISHTPRLKLVVEHKTRNNSEHNEERVVNVNKSPVLRVTGSAVEIDGFVRCFELVDDLEIVSIRCAGNTPGRKDGISSCAADRISLDLHFGIGLGTESTYELVMEQFRNYQRDGIGMEIELVHYRAGAAEERGILAIATIAGAIATVIGTVVAVCAWTGWTP